MTSRVITGKERKVIMYDAHTLFKGRNEIVIRHKGEPYRLRITRNDKLIMNK